jgi:hypothetical protein
MKKKGLLSAVLLLTAGATLSFAGSPVDRYNPYDPYRNESTRDQGPVVRPGGIYQGDEVTVPSLKDPRRWYDSEKDYQSIYEKGLESPKTLTHPYRDVKPYPSPELTSPYEGVIPPSPELPPARPQELTPPAPPAEY